MARPHHRSFQTSKAVANRSLQTLSKAQVRVVLPKRVDSLFCEYRLNKVVTITELNHRNSVVEKEFHRLFELIRELAIKIGTAIKEELYQVL